MLTFENTAVKLWRTVGFSRQLLIGGILFYIPLVNLLWLGYAALMIRRIVRDDGPLHPPDWSELRDLFQATVRALPVYLAIKVIPFFFAAIVAVFSFWFLELIGLPLLGLKVALIPFVLLAAILPAIFASAVYSVEKADNWNVFPKWRIILRRVIKRRNHLIFPTLMVYGIILLGLPVLGWAAFAAFMPYLVHCVLLFQRPVADL